MRVCYSNADINKARKSGEVSFCPTIDTSQIGTASVDLHIESIKRVDVDSEELNKQKRYKANMDLGWMHLPSAGYREDGQPSRYWKNISQRFLKQRKRESTELNHLRKYFGELNEKSVKPIDVKDGDFWYLDNSNVYIAQYRTRVGVPDDVQIDVTRRSSFARCGLDSFGWFYEDGVIKEILLPHAHILVPSDSCISQVSFYQRDDKNEDELLDPLRKDKKRTSVRRGYEYLEPITRYGNVGYELTMDENVMLFRGNTVDCRNICKDDFVHFDFKQSRIMVETYSFMLGRSKEHVKIGSKFMGELHPFDLGSQYGHESMNSSINAPKIWPMSVNHPVYEIPGDTRRIFHSASFDLSKIRTFLEIIKIKTPAIEPKNPSTYRRGENDMLPAISLNH